MIKPAALACLLAASAACQVRGRVGGDRELFRCGRLLELLLALDLGSLALKALVLDPARAAGRVPFGGWDRAAFHATQLAVLAWPFGLAALAWRTFSPRGWSASRAAAALWVGCAANTACAYPLLRGDALLDCYRWHVVLGLLLALAALLDRPAGAPPVGRAGLVSLLLLAGLAAELAGPYLGAPLALWWVAQATWVPVLLAVLLTAVWRSPWGRSRPSSSRSSPSPS